MEQVGKQKIHFKMNDKTVKKTKEQIRLEEE
jgi:hypothetical protein